MDSPKVFEWTDAHFCSLSSQTNIYGMQKLRTENNTNKLLVSSLNSSFLSVEYQKIGDRVTPLTKDIQFTHIPLPGEAEIVSIDVFERLPPKKGLVVGITYVMVVRQRERRHKSWNLSPEPEEPRKKESKDCNDSKSKDSGRKSNRLQPQESKPKHQVLNVYSAVLTEEEEENWGKENKLEIVAESCQDYRLSFVPFILTHTEIWKSDGHLERVFLLSGSDFKIHVYQEHWGSQPDVMEVPSDVFFPEFHDFACNVLQLEIINPAPNQRLTALGFEDGTVRVHLVDVKKKEMLQNWCSLMDSPVTSLHFFTQQKLVPLPPFMDNILDDASQSSNTEEDPSLAEINLVLTTALEPAIVYRDVLAKGLSEFLSLPNSEKYDSALCSLAADIDFDGQHELLVGTYGQEVLVYKFYPTIEKLVPVSPPDNTEAPPSTPLSKVQNKLPITNTPEHSEEMGKHRHKSDEGAEKISQLTQEQRKVKSQDDLLWLASEKGLLHSLRPCSEKGLLHGSIPERKDPVPLELRTVPEPHYKLLWQRSFPNPVMGLDSAEMMGDGIENLVVLTLQGVHIMQPNMNEVAKLIESRMQQMLASGPEAGDDFHKLQLE